MTQFGTGGLPATTRRRGSLEVPRTGITVTPNAPGVTPSAPLPNQQLLDLPNQISQLTTGLVQAAVKIQKMDRVEQQRVDTLERGMGSRDGRIELARFNDLIRTGQIDFDPNDTNEDIARRHFEDFSQGFSRSYREGAESAFVAKAIDATSLESKRLRKVQLDQGIEAVGSSIAGIGDAQQIRDQVDAARPFKGELSEAEFQFNLFSESLGAAQESGDTDRLNQLLRFTPDLPDDTRAKLIDQTDSNRMKIRGRQQKSRIDLLRREHAQGTPLEFVLDELDLSIDDGLISKKVGAALKEEFTGITKADLLRAENSDIRREVFEEFGALADLGKLSIEARDITFDKPGIKTIKREEIIEAVTTQRIESIFADESLSDDQKMVQSVEFLAANNVTYEPFRNQILAASSVSLSALTSDEIPDTVARGFELFKNMRAIDGQVLEAHLDSKGEARKFLETAQLLERVSFPGETQLALLETKRAFRPEAQRFDVSVDRLALDDGARRLAENGWSTDTQNISHLRGVLGRLAEVHVRRTGVSYEAALEQAEGEISARFSAVNQHLINTRANPLPQDLELLGREALKTYFDEHGADEGLTSAKQLSLFPDPDGNLWRVVRMDLDTGAPRPVENVPDSIITTEQLKEFRRVIRDRVIRQAVLDSKDPGIGKQLTRDAGKFVSNFVELGGEFKEIGFDAAAAVLAGATGTPQENKAARVRAKAQLKQIELGPLLTKTSKGITEITNLSSQIGLVAVQGAAQGVDNLITDIFDNRDQANGRTR